MYLTNLSVVYLEMGRYEDCIMDCDKVVERGRELRSDFKMIARVLTRKGTTPVKLAKCSQEYEPTIETFQGWQQHSSVKIIFLRLITS